MRNPRPAAAGMQLALAHFGVATWCALLGHSCDGVDGTCRCECHRR